MPRPSTAVISLTGALVAVAGAGCSASVSLHVGKELTNAKQAVSALITPKPRSVSCPSDIADKNGTKFTCKVTAPNGDQLVAHAQLRGGKIYVTSLSGGSSAAPTGTATGAGTTTTGTSSTSTGTSSTSTDTSSTGSGTSTGGKFTGTVASGY